MPKLTFLFNGQKASVEFDFEGDPNDFSSFLGCAVETFAIMTGDKIEPIPEMDQIQDAVKYMLTESNRQLTQIFDEWDEVIEALNEVNSEK